VTPYKIAIGSFFCFLVLSAVITLLFALTASLRRFMPLAWRVWAWGTFGFLAGYLVPGSVLLMLLFLVSAGVRTAPTDSESGFMIAALFYTPPVAAILGGFVGATVGYSRGRQKVQNADV
jgi:hypothetical protein